MFGNTFLSQNAVFPTRVSCDGRPNYKVGGITIDWTTVSAASGDVTLGDGSVIKDGQKYLRYGQILTRITSSGKYGPYDPSTTDGRQTLTRGECFILDQTLLQYSAGSSGLSAANDIVGGVFDGGSVWLARVLNAGSGSHSLTAGPTKTEFLTAFPGVQVTQDE
jgi:hypothetical protein